MPGDTTTDSQVVPAERETVISTILDGDAPETVRMPEDSYLPLLLAFGLLVVFMGLLPGLAFAQILIVSIGALITGIALFLWFWPDAGESVL
jgi:hypothetical protein